MGLCWGWFSRNEEKERLEDLGRTLSRKLAESRIGQLKLRKEEYYNEKYFPVWFRELKESPSRILFLHGLMGGELYDEIDDGVSWLNLTFLWKRGRLHFEEIDVMAGSKDVTGHAHTCRKLVTFPIIGRAYNALFKNDELQAAQFCYDWRDSSTVSAQSLHHFLSMVKIDEELRTSGIHLVCHSFASNVVMALLGQTDEFDDILRSMTFVGPAFHGGIGAIQVLEYGHGTSNVVDALLEVNQVATSFPSVFEVLPSPPDIWPRALPPATGSFNPPIRLRYPVRSGPDPAYMLDEGRLVNQHHMDLRSGLLEYGREVHRLQAKWREAVTKRLGSRIHVIVGLNGKTAFAATDGRKAGGGMVQNWVIHNYQRPISEDTIYNGDGLVLLQSSFLPGIDRDRHWGWVDQGSDSIHGELVDIDAVHQAIGAIAKFYSKPQGRKASDVPNLSTFGLLKYSDFVHRIFWARDAAEDLPQSESFSCCEQLNYMQRHRLRQHLAPELWEEHGLNNLDEVHKEPDCVVFQRTHQAAIRVLEGGEDLQHVCTENHIHPSYVQHHLLSLVAPCMY